MVLFVQVHPRPCVAVQDVVVRGEAHVVHVHEVEANVGHDPAPRVVVCVKVAPPWPVGLQQRVADSPNGQLRRKAIRKDL